MTDQTVRACSEQTLDPAPLTPEYSPEDHQVYLALLQKVLEKPNVRNVALTGRYGIGKSSVLRELERQDQSDSDAPKRIVTLSMSSLASTLPNPRNDHAPEPVAAAEGRQHSDAPNVIVTAPAIADTPTNVVQREIVKQLLYREPAYKMRGSHFHRIEPFRMREAVGLSALLGFLVAVVVALSGLPGNASAALGVTTGRPWVLTVIVMAVTGLLVAAACIAILKAMHNRLRVDQASIGSATIKLSQGINTYFDEYLDEIVYFFTQTPVRTVIFEDLDRFRDPHIFETLRELNNVLNSIQNLKKGPVRFVYALRDSIFDEMLDTPSVEEQMTAATDRVKFFDVIIPMVPFISPKVSHDLLRGQIESLPMNHQPSILVLNLVTPFLTDMRLIKNIRNEYAVFAKQLLRSDLSLTNDCLFAMVVYKNLRMSDFDRIGDGTSHLDEIHQAYRNLVNNQVDTLGKEVHDLQSQVDQIDHQELRARELGARLREVLEALGIPHDDQDTLDCLPQSVPMSEVATPTFWSKVSQGEIKVKLCRPGYASAARADLDARSLSLLMMVSLDGWQTDGAT